MTPDTIITVAHNAGFIVSAVYPYVIISLRNRAVSTLEVAQALNIPQSMCQKSGNDVLVQFA